MLARALAALAALGMIVGAIVVHDRRQEGGTERPDRRGASRVLCAAELGTACEGLDTAPAAVTANELAAAPRLDVATWVTAGPWPDLVDEVRAASNLPGRFGATRAVASTDLVAVVRHVPAECAEGVTWVCLGDAARETGRIATDGDRGSALRLLLRAAFAGGRIGRAEYARNDVVDNPEVADWLAEVDRALDRSVQFGAANLEAFLVTAGSADVYLTTAAAARGALPRGVTARTPTPPVRVDAVVAGPVPDGVREALLATGWVPAPQAEVGSPLPEDGLPSPGVLVALREVA